MNGIEIPGTQKGKLGFPFCLRFFCPASVHADSDLARFRFLDFRHVDLKNPVAVGGLDSVLLDGLQQIGPATGRTRLYVGAFIVFPPADSVFQP